MITGQTIHKHAQVGLLLYIYTGKCNPGNSTRYQDNNV